MRHRAEARGVNENGSRDRGNGLFVDLTIYCARFTGQDPTADRSTSVRAVDEAAN